MLTNRLKNGVRASATATAMAMATATGTDSRMIYIHSNLARFSNILASFLASVYLLVSQKETNIWPSTCATNKNGYTNKKWSFCNVYPCIGAKKSPFFQNKCTNASF